MTSPSLHLGYAGTVTSKYCGEVTHDRMARLIRQMRGKKIDRLRQRIRIDAVTQSGACHACGLDALFSQVISRPAGGENLEPEPHEFAHRVYDQRLVALFDRDKGGALRRHFGIATKLAFRKGAAELRVDAHDLAC